MCASFESKIDHRQLYDRFPHLKLSESLRLAFEKDAVLEFKVSGFLKTNEAPVLRSHLNVLEFISMNYSLCPSWSKEFPCKWSSYNARLERPTTDTKGPTEKSTQKNTGKKTTERIFEVPTWRGPFKRGQSCLVPLSRAIESAYFGSMAGHMMAFSSETHENLFAAGIWDEWSDTQTGVSKLGFALLTDDPDPFVLAAGHDRSLVILEKSSELEWLENSKMSGPDRFSFLRKNRIIPKWRVEKIRPLAKGWEKKAPAAQGSLF
jgi:putative SOS response-associated peptidase YedK